MLALAIKCTSLDQEFKAIRVEANALARREPLLKPVLSRVFLEQGTLQDALARRLAVLLAGSDASEDELLQLFLGLLQPDPSLANKAVRDLMPSWFAMPHARLESTLF